MQCSSNKVEIWPVDNELCVCSLLLDKKEIKQDDRNVPSQVSG